MKLKVLCWNIWIKGDFDGLCSLIKKVDPDIACFQEVKNDDPNLDIISFMESVGYHSFYSPVTHVWDGKTYVNGPAIFTKLDMEETVSFDLHESDNRKLQKVVINADSKKLNIYNTHLTHTHQKDSKIQNEQFNNALSNIDPNNSLLTGDFNATWGSEGINLLSGALKNTNRDKLPTWSLHVEGCDVCKLSELKHTLDHIFVTDDLEYENFQVYDSMASDHAALSIDVIV